MDRVSYVDTYLPAYHIVHLSIWFIPLLSKALIRSKTLNLEALAELDELQDVLPLELVELENCSHFLGFVYSVEYDLDFKVILGKIFLSKKLKHLNRF
jgi:hypothetical protein